eukprot:scaffold9796_cov154-Ochromonas_danica.AAC.11
MARGRSSRQMLCIPQLQLQYTAGQATERSGIDRPRCPAGPSGEERKPRRRLDAFVEPVAHPKHKLPRLRPALAREKGSAGHRALRAIRRSPAGGEGRALAPTGGETSDGDRPSTQLCADRVPHGMPNEIGDRLLVPRHGRSLPAQRGCT